MGCWFLRRPRPLGSFSLTVSLWKLSRLSLSLIFWCFVITCFCLRDFFHYLARLWASPVIFQTSWHTCCLHIESFWILHCELIHPGPAPLLSESGLQPTHYLPVAQLSLAHCVLRSPHCHVCHYFPSPFVLLGLYIVKHNFHFRREWK